MRTKAPSVLAAGRSRASPFPRRVVELLVPAAALIIASLWALTIGSSDLGLADVVHALIHDDRSRDHIVIQTVRLPRLLAGLLAGSSLAVAGALMQAVTNNPLASPGLLGINAGAAFAVVLSLLLFDPASTQTYVWYAFAGAGMAAIAVYGIGSIGLGGATPLKLVLAGAILSAFLASITTAILIFDKTTLDNVRLWSVGSLENRPLSSVTAVLPYIGVGLVSAVTFSRQITTMSLGPDVARSVGQDLVLWRWLAGTMVVLLAGSAVAMAGPVGFVGLVIPHVARFMAGSDYRRVIPISALCGALLVLLGDTLPRAAFPDRDIPVGVTMAILGAPFFIYLARYRLGRGN